MYQRQSDRKRQRWRDTETFHCRPEVRPSDVLDSERDDGRADLRGEESWVDSGEEGREIRHNGNRGFRRRGKKRGEVSGEESSIR